jgi:hypothetical protein
LTNTDPTTGLPLDTTVVVELPLSSWRIVLPYLQRGAYAEVAQVVQSITSQGDTQLLLLMNHARAARALSLAESANANVSIH